MANDPSQAYDLSLFEKREAKVIPLKVDQQKTRKRQNRHRLQKVINMAVTSIVTIGIVAVIAASIVLEVQLTEINNQISVEQAQTNHLISETERLKGEQAAHTSAQSVEQYAKENGMAFETYGENCSLVDADGAWEGDDRGHFHACEHGVKLDREDHSNSQGYISNCGDECGVCGIQYCDTVGFVYDLVTVNLNAKPATCISPEYTGDVQCSCGRMCRQGEYVGPTKDNHTPEDRWMPASPTEHYQKCRDCGTVVTRSEHVGGTATFTEKAKCEVCDQEYGKVGPHEHTGGKATEIEQAICEICQKPYGDRLPIESSPKEEEKPSEKEPFDPTFIIIGGAAVVLIVAVVLIAVVKKKRTAVAKREE